MNIFITTQMRTGSTWLCDLVAGLFGKPWVFWEKGKDIPQSKFKEQMEKKGNNIIKLHYAHPKTICECIKPGDKENFVISITRDIRDTAVSKILYMRYDEPMRKLDRLRELEKIRNEFGNKGLTDKRYINLFIQTPFFRHIIKNWKMYNDGYTHPNYLLIEYELLHARRLYVMKTICEFLGLYRDNKALRKIIIRNNFQSKSGRKNGEEINSSFRRKGIVGDYRNYINKENLDLIKKLLNDG